MRNPDRQVCITQPPQFSLLSRANSTFCVTFAYNPDTELMPR